MATMNFYKCVNNVLLGLAVIAFLGQALFANAAHHHPHNGHASIDIATAKDVANVDSEIVSEMDMAADHQHHHATIHPSSSDPNADIGENENCCSEQCQCAATSCSAFIAITNQTCTRKIEHSVFLVEVVDQSPLYFSSALFRPPILPIV